MIPPLPELPPANSTADTCVSIFAHRPQFPDPSSHALMKTIFLTITAAIFGWCFALLLAPIPQPEQRPSVPENPRLHHPQPAQLVEASVPENSTKPAHQRIRDAVDSRSSFASAPKLVAIVDAMTAEDFAAIVANPTKNPAPWGTGLDLTIGPAFMDMLVARWLEVNPTGAYEQIKALEKGLVIDERSIRSGSGNYFEALARIRPQLLLDAPDFVANRSSREVALHTAFSTLGRENPALAREYIERLGKDGAQYANSVERGFAKRDPIGAMSSAIRLNDKSIFQAALAEAARRGPAELRAVLQMNDKRFEIEYQLPELVVRFPDEDWDVFIKDKADNSKSGYTDSMLRLQSKLSIEEIRGQLTNLDRIPEAARRRVVGPLLLGWSESEPEAALDWSLKNPAFWEKDFGPAALAFSKWNERDSSAALAWAKSQPPSPLSNRITNTIATSLAQAGSTDEALAAFRVDGASANTLANFAGLLKTTTAAKTWFASLPADADAANAAGVIARKLVRETPEAAAEWIGSLSAGPRRDAAVRSFALQAVENDPAAAGEWVATISNPVERGTAAGIIHAGWSQRDPRAANLWLRELPGMDEQLRDRILRRGWR